MTDDDRRISINAADYLRHQHKQDALDARRPVIRKAADLVGPGIGAAAVVITDFNDQLATYNGYYSAAPGAAYAPNETEAFIGSTVMDDTLGGWQSFVGLTSGVEYSRVFRRSPSDASSIAWGLWTSREAIPAAAYTQPASKGSQTTTKCFDGVDTKCILPLLNFVGVDTFSRATTSLNIKRSGVYTGHLALRTIENVYFTTLTVLFPNDDAQANDTVYSYVGTDAVLLPINFYASDGLGFVQVVANTAGDANLVFTRLHLTRVG